MTNIVNVHRRETANRGDLASGPHNYFPGMLALELTGWKRPDDVRREPWLASVRAADIVILGGGGLLEFEKHRDSLDFVGGLEGKKKVIWGAGHNISTISSWSGLKPTFSGDFSMFDLVGIRDDGHGFDWVPCVSCMHSAFDVEYPITKEYIFFANLGSKDSRTYVPRDFDEALIVGNLKSSVEDIVAALGSAETVITSSYHGAYWATLLGRKVVGIPTSSKFYDLRHPIPICHRSDWKRFTKLARIHDGALEECRQANLGFYDKVMNLS
jgi:hypothetical protein